MEEIRRELLRKESEAAALAAELERARQAAERMARERGGLEARLAVQTAELARRQVLLERSDAALDQARTAITAGGHWEHAARAIRAFWQSPVVIEAINRRITGDPRKRPEQLLKERFFPQPAARALFVGPATSGVVPRLLTLEVCTQLVVLDGMAARVTRGRHALPSDLEAQVVFEASDLLTWKTADRFDAVVVQGTLGRVTDIEQWVAAVEKRLTPGAILHIDDDVGQRDFEATDKQVEIVGRLLDRLSDHLKRDLVADDGRMKQRLTRPAAAFPSGEEASTGRAQKFLEALARRLELLALRPYAGGVFAPTFNRTMGNFIGYDDLVRTLMELDFILTDEGVLDSAFIWAVYRAPSPSAPEPAPDLVNEETPL